MINSNLKFKKYVLLDLLKTTIATVSILIENGCTDNSRLVMYTNYYSAIALKSFQIFNNENRDYTRKEMAIKKINLIYSDCFAKAQEDSEDLKDYFKFNDEYNLLDTDEKLVIMAILTLSGFYKTKSINKIKNILRTYISKLKNCIKNADEYYKVFNVNLYNKDQAKYILFKFLIENS